MSATPRDAADAGGPLRHSLPAVLLGGIAGGAARLALTYGLPGVPQEATVLLANLAGAFALGVLFERLTEHRLGRTAVWAFWGPGFLGAFTTFSALALLAVAPESSGWLHGALYLAASVGLGVPVAALGRRLGRAGA